MKNKIVSRNFIDLLKGYLVLHNRKAIGYSEEEIKKIEKLYDIEVKGDFKEFLKIAGRKNDGLLPSEFIFFSPLTKPNGAVIYQNYIREEVKKINSELYKNSKIFIMLQLEVNDYFINTKTLNVYFYDENFDDISGENFDFNSFMIDSTRYYNPNMEPYSVICEGELLPKSIENNNKNVTPQEIEDYLIFDKKNENNFIYLLKNYLKNHNKQSMGYNDEEIEEIERLYEITIDRDLKDFFKIAGRSDGGFLSKNDLIFYKNWTIRKHILFQDDFKEECLIENKHYSEACCYPFIFYINNNLYYFLTTKEKNKYIEDIYTEKDRVHCYNIKTNELTHTGKTFNEFMVDLVKETNSNLELGEEKIGEMLEIKIDDEDLEDYNGNIFKEISKKL